MDRYKPSCCIRCKGIDAMKQLSSTDQAILIAHLLDESIDQTKLHAMLTRLAATPAEQQQIFAQVQWWLEAHNDPAWLEMAAAAHDGLRLPEMEEWLAVREALADIAPLIVHPFDLLQAISSDEEPLLPSYPTFVEQWQQQNQAAPPAWVSAVGFEWQQWQETGRLLIRQIQDALTLPVPLLTPVAVKGHAANPAQPAAELLQRITLNQAELEDCDVEAVLWRNPQAPHACTLVVSVQIPSRWPDLAGIPVQVKAGAWQAEGRTNADGEVTFAEISEELIPLLLIEIQTSHYNARIG